MLEDEGTAISFTPGVRATRIPGRIVVHDRIQVESQVLPRYFNHASFASLRRQLNYFAFSREGKGKQKGATYINDQVYDLNDILCLKRRLPGSTSPVASEMISGAETCMMDDDKEVVSGFRKETSRHITAAPVSLKGKRNSDDLKQPNKKVRKIIDSVVPVLHLPNKKEKQISSVEFTSQSHSPSTKDNQQASTISVSPSTNTITTLLDLTKPEAEESSTSSSSMLSHDNAFYQRSMLSANMWPSFSSVQDAMDRKREEDVIAGCSALLSLGWQR